MPRNRQHIPPDERRTLLLDAAFELFLDTGYENATISAIGAAAGMTRPNFYWYYATKEDLLADLMNRVLDRELVVLDDRFGGQDPRAQLVTGIEDMRGTRRLHQAMHDHLASNEAVGAAHDRFLDWFRELARAVVDQAGLPARERDEIVDMAVFLFEGFNAPLDLPRPGHEMLDAFLGKVIGAPRRRPRAR